jgi:hypothetical protein
MDKATGLNRRSLLKAAGWGACAAAAGARSAAWGQFIHPQKPAPRGDDVTEQARALRKSRWSPSRAFQYMALFGPIKGTNYVPADQFSVWEDPGDYYIGRELGWAHDIGLNSVRLWAPGSLFQSGQDRFFSRFDQLLDVLAKRQLTLTPVLSVGSLGNPKERTAPPSPAPAQAGFRPGVHGSLRRSVPLPPAYRAEWPGRRAAVEEFVTATLRRYSGDKRIVCWDLWNEPQIEDRPMVEDMFAFARQADPSQPLTATWQGEDLSDVYSFHTYGEPGKPEGPEPGLAPFDEELQRAVDSGRPLLCTECLARTFGNTFETFLPPFARHKVGWYIWGLCAGSAQHHFPWRWPVGSPEPKTWFHCVLYPDGTHYREQEIALIKAFGF